MEKPPILEQFKQVDAELVQTELNLRPGKHEGSWTIFNLHTLIVEGDSLKVQVRPQGAMITAADNYYLHNIDNIDYCIFYNADTAQIEVYARAVAAF
jgi:hypothetical protein